MDEKWLKFLPMLEIPEFIYNGCYSSDALKSNIKLCAWLSG